jgi:radical SAM/Cys-rich protein
MSVKQKSKSLKARESNLSSPYFQLEVLSGQHSYAHSFPNFATRAGREILPVMPEILQINVGKLCNQSCAHCHVDAGPDRKQENMTRATMEKLLQLLDRHPFRTVDITGGAPEMNPHFRWFVESCRARGVDVINRCNLTIITSHRKYYDLPEFFAHNKVRIVASLPYFSKSRTDNQRGEGVFDASINALKMLNAAGYGAENTDLKLDLVYNPAGTFLPGDQQGLEKEFKEKLYRLYQITFHQLLTITNLPVSRFLDHLLSTGQYESYMQTLIDAFNPSTMDGLMCRNTISVSWDGFIYDCDFNQMLDLKADCASSHIDYFDIESLMKRTIVTNQHCYGCTAGAGSSCGGEIVR